MSAWAPRGSPWLHGGFWGWLPSPRLLLLPSLCLPGRVPQIHVSSVPVWYFDIGQLVGVFTPQKAANATNQALFPLTTC